jgi:hypothetical protein
MSSALLDAPARGFGFAQPAGGSRPTLEELLDSTWQSARASGTADCPVCHGTMRLAHDAARCDGCGTTLA